MPIFERTLNFRIVYNVGYLTVFLLSGESSGYFDGNIVLGTVAKVHYEFGSRLSDSIGPTGSLLLFAVYDNIDILHPHPKYFLRAQCRNNYDS